LQQGFRTAFGSGSFAPWLERGKHQRVVLALPEEAEAAHHDQALHLVLRHPEIGDGLQCLVHAFFRGTGRSLHRGYEKALILGRQEGGRQAHE